MLDLLYVTGTITFFALMLGYVRFCERLAGPDNSTSASTEKRA